MRDLEVREEREALSERIWGEWKTKVMLALEKGIGKKRVLEMEVETLKSQVV